MHEGLGNIPSIENKRRTLLLDLTPGSLVQRSRAFLNFKSASRFASVDKGEPE